MKRIHVFFFTLTTLCLTTTSCSDSSVELQNNLKHASSKIHISPDMTSTNEPASIVIYDYDESISGLSKFPVTVQTSLYGHPKANIVEAFLTNNHILDTADQVRLLKVEEVGTRTNFYLSSTQDLVKPSTRKLFNKALELTLLRHLKHNNFSIIYNETAQL